MADPGVIFGATKQGVMVQLFYAAPTDPEWADLLRFVETHQSSLRAFLAVGHGGTGPTSKQRQQLAEYLKAFPMEVPFALLTKSRVNRGALTALNWITGRGNVSRAFRMDELEPALDFLRVERAARGGVRDLMRSLESQQQRAVGA
jgi:hypothetical protein